ncbi:hypothetical protein BDB00DRAFT_870582 [Zychaea mexicana]|uniref:uncharacterized protein n=1 Tax=Zychaea mexicana TaxID=64656 RepID=UPI0022FE7898|nr:uncharacterized protein BDB00DRAFT_870582 [Zychaea mexicana]KAI9495434.1 hypothetical protein BDB00DRAFT_870582 [Zychaea mexicana]
MTLEEESSDDYDVFDDIFAFRLSNDQLLGKDQFSKQSLKKQEVIDLVVSDFLGVPNGTYTSAETEWPNPSRSDVLYKPQLPVQNSLPPVLI